MKRACVAVIDAAHARVFSYSVDNGRSMLEELHDRVSPGRQAHGMFADKQSEGIRNGNARPNATDDHRTDHIAELDDRFARDMVAEVTKIVRAHAFRRVIVVATPKMLGCIRQEIEPLRRSGVTVDEIPQDLTRL